MMEYRGYRAAVKFDDDAGIFHGEVIDTLDVITFQGETVVELRQAFADSVDEYLTVCAERGRMPDKPFSGRIPLRVSPAVDGRGESQRLAGRDGRAGGATDHVAGNSGSAVLAALGAHPTDSAT
jgi:predicted HicB family RNase H-like nuclease